MGISRSAHSRRATTERSARGFPRIKTPTLIISGEEDPVLVPSTIDRAEELTEDLTLRYLPGVGHWAQQEAPEEVNEMLATWLTDHQ